MLRKKYIRFLPFYYCAFVIHNAFAGVSYGLYENIFKVISNPEMFNRKNIQVSGYLIESDSQNESTSLWVSIFHDGLDKTSSIKIYMDNSRVPNFIDGESLYIVRGYFEYCKEHESCNYKITLDERIGNVSRPIIKTVK